jgi:molybdopterin synthase catalytic subunit
VIRVQAEDFDPGVELAGFAAGNRKVGGVCLFLGLVRDFLGATPDGATPVTGMTLEHYPGMTEKQLAAIEAEARDRWPLEEVLIIHRHGRLDAGDRIVLVAAASAHREAAFEACHFLIDWLKTKAPFWKLEHADGGDVWVEARQSDGLAADRWTKKP